GGTGVSDPKRGDPKMVRYGTEFTHVAAPCKPISGVVRDAATRRPLAGCEVTRRTERSDDAYATGKTDADGRYRRTGRPAGEYALVVRPPDGATYLITGVTARATSPGLEPVTFDIALVRRPVVAGRVLDRSGKPVTGWVGYRPLADNPHLKSAAYL